MSVAGLTACGDKVNVTQPAPDSAVTQVVVTPSSQNMNVGDKVTLVATVVAGPQQTNRNVTWTPSDATVASVDAAGVVTANKGGVATIIAASAANPAVKGNAVITVAAQVLATVTVGQINTTVCVPNGACTSVPAVLNNVHDQLDVTLNVDPGTQKISEVDLIMNCGGADTVVQKQTFATADVAPAAEDASAPTTLSFNTAGFNPTTGAVGFKNGVCTIKAKAITTAGTQSASGTQQLTLNNVDFISATTTTTPSTGQVASAPAANGLVWRAGAVNVTAIPVIYSANSIASATISLLNGGTDAALGQNGASVAANGGVVATLSNIAPASGVVTASFPNSTSATAGVGGSTVDTLFTQVTTVSSTGNAGPALTLPAVAAIGTNFIRLDNRAPDISGANVPVVNLNVQNNQNNWLGANFVFKITGSDKPVTLTTGAGSTSEDWLGVDVVKINTFYRVAGSGSSFTAFTKVSDIAESSSSTNYELRVQVCDALGNCANYTPGTLLFGVDLTAPTLTQIGGVKDGDIYSLATGAPTGGVSFSVFDPVGTGGVSGSGTSANGILVKDQALRSNGIPGSKTECALGNATGSSPAITCASPKPYPNTLPFTGTEAAAAADGEYAMSVQALDQAGNTSAAVNIKYYVDLTVPTIPTQGSTIPNPITTGTAFNGYSTTDNMDVKAGYGSLIYGAGSFAESGTAAPAGAAFDNVLVQQSVVGVTLTTFYRSLTNAVGTAGTLPTTLNVNVSDVAGNLGTPLPQTLPGVNISTATIPLFNAGSNAITAFAIDSTKPGPATDISGKPFTFYVNATPASDLTGNPLQQVCFFWQPTSNNQFGSGAAAGDLVKIGCTPGQGTVGVGATRRFFYSFTWTPPASFAPTPLSFSVFAVGNTSATAGNDAIISAPVTVTVNTPP